VPEVFISYQWGDHVMKGNRSTYSTQETVKEYRKVIELHTDVLCWLDCEGGMRVGEGHVRAMKEGIEKAQVVLMFLSDDYVNSRNCRLEFMHIKEQNKFVIPLLCNSDGTQGSKWKGMKRDAWRETVRSGRAARGEKEQDSKKEDEDKDWQAFWWRHAEEIESPKHEQKVDWRYLSFFDPLDLRGLGQSPETLRATIAPELIKRITERFHRGRFLNHARKMTFWTKMQSILAMKRGSAKQGIAPPSPKRAPSSRMEHAPSARSLEH